MVEGKWASDKVFSFAAAGLLVSKTPEWTEVKRRQKTGKRSYLVCYKKLL